MRGIGVDSLALLIGIAFLTAGASPVLIPGSELCNGTAVATGAGSDYVFGCPITTTCDTGPSGDIKCGGQTHNDGTGDYKTCDCGNQGETPCCHLQLAKQPGAGGKFRIPRPGGQCLAAAPCLQDGDCALQGSGTVGSPFSAHCVSPGGG
jgi:hypothetical protein